MKPFTMWVIVDKAGRLWRRTDGSVVVWDKRQDAHYGAIELDPKRCWRATKVTCSVAQRSGDANG